MVKVSELSITQGNHLLFSNLSFHLLAGESVCICGESGSGKSSLLKALLGFVSIESGDVWIDGIKLEESQIDRVRQKTAWLPQEVALPSEWVSEMVHLPFDLKANRAISFDKTRLMCLFDELGLDQELYQKQVSEISGGERQRIMLAVAAMLRKKIILVDEPTSALDVQSTDLVIRFFKRLCREEGVAIVAVSHDEKFALNCTKIVNL